MEYLKDLDVFHDALFQRVNIDWEIGQAEFVFVLTHEEAGSSTVAIICKEFTDLHFPKKEPWGESRYVNNVFVTDYTLKIEMQSGDTLIVCSAEVTSRRIK